MAKNNLGRRSFLGVAMRGCIALLVLTKLDRIFYPARAALVPEIVISSRKRITPQTTSENRPEFFPNTNNLRRKAGSPFLAKGYFLSIEGYVTDLIDVPIENVVIKMWQANHFGYYQHAVDPEDIEKFDQDFLGCGKTITDNLGYYSFITIEPGYYGDSAPHVHFSLQCENYNQGRPIETIMFFPDHPLNKRDKRYNALSKKDRSLLTCDIEPVDPENPQSAKRALFNFKLDMLHPLKRY